MQDPHSPQAGSLSPTPAACRLKALRAKMARHGWDAVIIADTDPHNSEYLPKHWDQRAWFTGFTGSLGTAVVTATEAALWTDSRYFIQAEKQLAGSGYALQKLRVPGAVDIPTWLRSHLQPGAVMAIDGSCTPCDLSQQLEQQSRLTGGSFVDVPDLFDDLWTDRPPLPEGPVILLDEQYTGRSRTDKIRWLRAQMVQAKCSHFLVSALDQLAWLLNLRCLGDIAYNPVAIAYALVSPDSLTLFIAPQKLSASVTAALLADGIATAPYETLPDALAALPAGAVLWADSLYLNFRLSQSLRPLALAGGLYDHPSPITLEKARKNPVELEGFRLAYRKDGLALTRFFIWLEAQLAHGEPITEWDAAQKLRSLRAQGEAYMGESFATISAYGPSAALPHYETLPEGSATLRPRGLYLVDSGAHYLHGTTDITRTLPLGPLTELEREDYTLVLKGMIDLSLAVFPAGTRGCQLDATARLPLWKALRDYGHGTGHGIGHFLCVHEGPQDLRQNLKDQPLLPGMVTSNEPGLYRAGAHGIRHENVLCCVEKGESDFGTWLGFETLTLCYIDTRALRTDLLSPEELQWLRAYNRHVIETLAPQLTAEEVAWLEAHTRL